MERSIAKFIRRNSSVLAAAAAAASSTQFQASLPKLISSFHVCETRLTTTSSVVNWPQNRINRRVCFVEAQARKGCGDNNKGSSRRHDPLFAGGGGMISECPVPWEQQPVNEYQSLVETGLFSWATDDVRAYVGSLTAVGIAVSVLVAWPVVALSISPQQELVKCCVGALSGGVLASMMVALRLYLGWAYIGNRLFSATVEYEKTGWYDGEVWVKSPEVLARDRLLGSFKAIHGPEHIMDPPLIAQDSEEEESISGTARLAYSEASARQFEPDAFVGEEEDSNKA